MRASPAKVKWVARSALAALVRHHTVVIHWTRRGRYRRIIGQVYCDGTWINAAPASLQCAVH